MHLVIIAWLFVAFTMALTMKSALAGVALFGALGMAPVLIYLAFAVRRLRARRGRGRPRGSRLEGDTNGGDDRHAERDE